MKRTLLAFVILAVSSIDCFSQKLELGNVTLAELQEKVHPKDSSAVAAILFEKGNTFFEFRQGEGFSLITEVETKIKIYKKEGYEWANQEVAFYSPGSDPESVDFSKSITYNLVNGQIEKTKTKKENEFSEVKNKFWSSKKLAMPNVKEGSIIEYKYTIRSPYISRFPDWRFQKTIPVNHSRYVTDIPEYFFYNVYRKGTLFPTEEKDRLNKSIRIDEKTLSTTRTGAYNHDVQNINYFVNRTIYKLDDIAAINEEAYVNNINNYIAALEHEHSGTQMPQQTFKSYSTTWEDVTKYIYENPDFGQQLNKSNYYEDDLKTLLQGLTTDEEKIATVFTYVQNRMSWDKYNSYLCDGGVKKAYDDKTGNAAEINLMLVSMLRFAKLDANPVLVSTRSNGVALFPSRTAYNFVIAAVNVNNALVLLDATSKIALPNVLPTRDLNWFGRVIRKDGTSDLVDLLPKNLSYETTNVLANMDASGAVSGKVRIQYSNHSALRYRDNFAGTSNDAVVEKIEEHYNGLEVSEYEVSNTALTEPVVEKYSLKSSNVSEIIGDKIYFSPMLYYTFKENPFKQETREYPVDFSFPFRDKYMVSVTIPDGYQVESLPKPISLSMNLKAGTFSYTVTNTANQIQVASVLDINTSIIAQEDYVSLKEFFKMVVDKQNEKIVLKKI